MSLIIFIAFVLAFVVVARVLLVHVVIFIGVVVVGHVVGVVEIDDLGRLLEHLESLAGDGQVERRCKASRFGELENYLLRHVLIHRVLLYIVHVAAGGVLLSILLWHLELVLIMVQVSATGLVVMELKGMRIQHGKTNYRNPEVLSQRDLNGVAKDLVL